MGIAGLVLAAAMLQAPGQAPPRHPQPLPDPVVEPVRIELRISTTARTTSLRVLDDLMVLGAVAQASGPGRAIIEQAGVAIINNTDGTPASAIFRLVVTSNVASLRLTAGVSPGRTASFEVWNVNDEAHPARVSEFTAAAGVELDTNMALLRTGGPLTIPQRDRLVLAHWYPWWDAVAWADPQLLDQPLRLYSTDSAADVARDMQDVAHAGIDAVIVSWQGSEVGGGWNLRRLRYVLDGAQQAGLKVSVNLETLAANKVGREGAPPDPDVLTAWIVELVDTLATHPAWLKVDGRPVIFAYVWGFAGDDTWRTVLNRVRAGGRNPLMMADSTDPAHLSLADGLATYSGTLFAPDVGTLMRTTVSAVPGLAPARRGLRRPAHRGGHRDARLRRNEARGPLRPRRQPRRRRVLRSAVGSGAGQRRRLGGHQPPGTSGPRTPRSRPASGSASSTCGGPASGRPR